MKVHRGCAILIICLMSLEVTLAGITVAQGAVTAQIASDPSLDITLESFKGTLPPVTIEASPGDVVQLRVTSKYNGPIEHVGICLVVDGRYNPPGILSFESGSPPPSETRGSSYYWDFGNTGQVTRGTEMNIKVSGSAVPCNDYRAFVEMGYYWKGESVDITTQPIIIHIRCEQPPPPPPVCTSGWTQTYRCAGNIVERLFQNADCTEEWKIQDDCDRYSPPRICENGRCECMSGPPGLTQTYRCYNNQVQQLYRNRDCSEVWQVKDDCNKYDPARKCYGGVCMSVTPPPPPPPPKCNQTECQGRDKFFGNIYCKDDGITYQRYRECNCLNENCTCNSSEKEVSKGIISGHVYDAVTKKPIAGATVVTPYIIYTTQRAYQCASQTDATGYYRLYPCTPCPTFAPFSYYVLSSCSAPGYVMTGMTDASTDEDGNAVVDFNMTRCDFELIAIEPVQVVYNATWFVVGKPTVVHLKIRSTFDEINQAKVKLSYGDKTFETNLEGDVLINPDVGDYWIPDGSWSAPWFEFPGKGTYKISVKVDSAGDYAELDESNNGKEISVLAKESKRNELRLLYKIIEVDNYNITYAQLIEYAEQSSAYIKATFPINKIAISYSDSHLKENGANWRFWTWIYSDSVLDELSGEYIKNYDPQTKSYKYDYIIGVLPAQARAWFGNGYCKPAVFKGSILSSYADFAAPAHEIGHSEGLWKSGEEYDIVSYPNGRPAFGYWVERHTSLGKKGTFHQDYCLMGKGSWICDECYKNLLNNFT